MQGHLKGYGESLFYPVKPSFIIKSDTDSRRYDAIPCPEVFSGFKINLLFESSLFRHILYDIKQKQKNLRI